jgi:hypothetical protein
MKDNERQKLLSIIQEQKKDNKNALIAITIFAAFALLFLILLISSLYDSNKNKEQICLPKMSGFFQAIDGTHAVAIFDTLDKDQAQLANEVNSILGQINNLKIKGDTK